MPVVSSNFPIPSDLPKEIGGQPVTYLWKDVIRDGTFFKQSTKQTVKVTPERRQRFIENFELMQKNGRKVNVPVDHSFKAEDNQGYVVALKNDKDRTHALLQLIGEDAARCGARNDVSVFIRATVTDSDGHTYTDAIEHVALTPVPVITGLQHADIAASQLEILTWSNTMPLDATPEILEKLKVLVPATAKAKDDEILSLVVSHLSALAAEAEAEIGTDEVASLSREDINKKASELRAANRKAAAELVKVKAENLSLSRAVPKKLETEVAEAMVDALTVKKELCVARGALNPATADVLFSMLVTDGKTVNDFALSKNSGSKTDSACLALRVFKALESNKPVPLSEETGIQRLSKDMDDKDDEETTKEKKAAKTKKQFTEGMKAVASGKASTVKIVD